MTRVLVALALLAAAPGCIASYARSPLAAASHVVPPVELEILAEGVEGRDCDDFLDRNQAEALDAALAAAPGADVLLNATYTFQAFCLIVRGDAARWPRP